MESQIVGVDVGAMTVKAVLLSTEGEVVTSAYTFHRGNPLAALREVMGEFANGNLLRIALTGSGAKLCPRVDDILRVNDVQATIVGVRQARDAVQNIIDIGGASLTLVRLDKAGRFRGYATNSQCAAGTGSFLDEQATRLGLTYQEMAGFHDIQSPPSVAARCAVFAKSDLIHLQQAGATKAEMWSGLCRGMSQTALQTLLKGKPLGGLTAMVGGVAQNYEVVRWLRELTREEIVTDENAHLTGALGAALIAHRESELIDDVQWRDWLGETDGSSTQVAEELVSEPTPCFSACGDDTPRTFASEHSNEPLALRRTKYPSFEVEESYTDDQANEVRMSRWPGGDIVRGVLGIDIGSTSTKLCLIDPQGEVMVDIYRNTAGDPIDATKKLFDALRDAADRRGSTVEVIGCGTTGSGRKLVGSVVGADAIINEISGHVAGAMHVDPEIETIFEIGGQDSKYMRCRNGQIIDANMNYVCAAGTGSFVEEQARKLGIHLHDVGDLVLGVVPPPSSDRCTVFMEQDVNKLLRSGRTSAQALAAVMRSVVQNYLNKVVGNRPYSSTKIAFQGATARNKGLVAAFETLLGVEVVVSPYCHVMGAWGVALLTQARLNREKMTTTFVGLDLSKRKVTLRKEPCDLCNNDCEITFATIEGNNEETSWGYVCGRDPSDTKMRVLREHDLFKKRDRWLKNAGAAPEKKKVEGKPKVVAIPRALATYSHYPMWRRLLEELGVKVILTGETSRTTREKGAALTGAEFCFPVKVAHGAAAEAMQAKADFVFIPHFVAQPQTESLSNSFLCPYVQAYPSVVRTALSLAGCDRIEILAPELDRRRSEYRQCRDMFDVIGKPLGVTFAQVRKAFRAGVDAQEKFEKRLVDAGRKTLDQIAAGVASGHDPRPGIVIIGRPYNVNDTGINLDLPRKIAEMGYRVIPIDALPFEPERIHSQYRNTYWASGQRILAALEYVRQRDDLFAIYFSNFNCGPESFLLTYAEEIMGDKPLLALELDEHGADAGYITRIEAFLDVARSWMPGSQRPDVLDAPNPDDDMRSRRIWIPAMHPVSSELFAAAFRGHGYDAVAIPSETQSDLEVGQRVARGCECLPMRTTIGSFLNATKKDAASKHCLFMPTAAGPCRYGQYVTLNRQIFNKEGHADTTIVSPTSDNAYAGMSDSLRRSFWKSLLVGDLLYKMTLRVRPYEVNEGETDAALDEWKRRASRCFEHQRDPLAFIAQAGTAFATIPTRDIKKPL
ncbi:MAG: acyl-CoA dehydratase activase, partial [Myxococcota bacterium]